MKQTYFLMALLSMVIGSANMLQAHKPTAKSGPVISAPDLAKLSIGQMLEQPFESGRNCNPSFLHSSSSICSDEA